MSSVFISHSSRDKPFARRLANDLREHGVDVWFDEVELPVGDDLAQITASISHAEYLVVVVSTAAMHSSWVQKELDIAKEAGVSVLPVLLEDAPAQLQGDLAKLAIADFRRGYRRALWRIIEKVANVKRNSFLTGKQAARLVNSERAIGGDVFGLSQQGVATLYSLANRKDWLFADALEGLSRLWIVEIYNRRNGSVHPFCVKDSIVHDLPVLCLFDSDPVPAPNSAIILSCALNELPSPFTSHARLSPDDQRERSKRIDKRYTRFRPVPMTRFFVDSDVAVESARTSSEAVRLLGERADELFIMTKLEVDRSHGNSALWSVSFFDVALAQSVLTVGVDAAKGRIQYPQMRPEILNANFMNASMQDGKVVVSIANQMRAIDRHAWHIAAPGEPYKSYPTAADALRLTKELLGDEMNHWQLAFLSNTGVVEAVVSRYGMSCDRLMKTDGSAGQWVVELCGATGTPVSDGKRTGFEYAFRRLLVTPEDGAVINGPDLQLALTTPLHSCPLPPKLLDAYEDACDLAMRSVEVEFEAMSVALARASSGAQWAFRFYGVSDVVEKILVTGDGKRVLTTPTRDQSGRKPPISE